MQMIMYNIYTLGEHTAISLNKRATSYNMPCHLSDWHGQARVAAKAANLCDIKL